jgi:hypothetical protein
MTDSLQKIAADFQKSVGDIPDCTRDQAVSMSRAIESLATMPTQHRLYVLSMFCSACGKRTDGVRCHCENDD